MATPAPSGSSPAPTDLTATTSRVCHICTKSFARYTCPKCNVAYCGLECYRKHPCSNQFLQENLAAEMKGYKVSKEERQKMLQILQRLHSEVQDAKGEGKEEDEEEESWKKLLELASKPDSELSLSALSEKQRQAFWKAVRSGELIERWRPWWMPPLLRKRRQKRTEEQEEESIRSPSSSSSTSTPEHKEEEQAATSTEQQQQRRKEKEAEEQETDETRPPRRPPGAVAFLSALQQEQQQWPHRTKPLVAIVGDAADEKAKGREGEGEEEEEEDGWPYVGLSPEAPAEPRDLPLLSQLMRTGATPSPTLVFSLIDILYAHCYTQRLYNGDTAWDLFGAAEALLSLSPVLTRDAAAASKKAVAAAAGQQQQQQKKGPQYEDLNTVLQTSLQLASQPHLKQPPAFTITVIRDVAQILFYKTLILRALSQARSLLSATLEQAIKEKEKERAEKEAAAQQQQQQEEEEGTEDEKKKRTEEKQRYSGDPAMFPSLYGSSNSSGSTAPSAPRVVPEAFEKDPLEGKKRPNSSSSGTRGSGGSTAAVGAPPLSVRPLRAARWAERNRKAARDIRALEALYAASSSKDEKEERTVPLIAAAATTAGAASQQQQQKRKGPIEATSPAELRRKLQEDFEWRQQQQQQEQKQKGGPSTSITRQLQQPQKGAGEEDDKKEQRQQERKKKSGRKSGGMASASKRKLLELAVRKLTFFQAWVESEPEDTFWPVADAVASAWHAELELLSRSTAAAASGQAQAKEGEAVPIPGETLRQAILAAAAAAEAAAKAKLASEEALKDPQQQQGITELRLPGGKVLKSSGSVETAKDAPSVTLLPKQEQQKELEQETAGIGLPKLSSNGGDKANGSTTGSSTAAAAPSTKKSRVLIEEVEE